MLWASALPLGGCLMSHSARSARPLPAGKLQVQFDSRIGYQRQGDQSKVDVPFPAGSVSMLLGLGFGGVCDIWLDYGATDNVTATVVLGFGTGTLAGDVRYGLMELGPMSLAVSGGAWIYPLGAELWGGRVGLLTATRLGGSVDFLLNGHLSSSHDGRLIQMGGAFGFDIPEVDVFGLRPMLDYSYVPFDGAPALHAFTLVIGFTFP